MPFPRIGRLFSGLIIAILIAVSGAASAGQSKKTQKTDAEIRREIVAASIAAYSGNCPCPYNSDRRGRSCGRRSAYSRIGGASPLCYPSDVTKQMVEEYRKRSKR